ncbi:tetraspanin-2-like [Zingiber officinale]|uniref:tetraspanin-2-like n=1 Tax=Zingiber officinale TaxID=94328 RepID=UPI001C4C7BFC|nr:tetraspanin-2-like [Zingiber officinale]
MATARNASHGSTTALLNFVALLCSIPVIGAGIWLSSKQDNECVHLARWPVVILGVLLLLASLAGFVGAYWNRPALLAAYFSCMAALIVILFSLVAFAYAVTAPDGSYAVPGRAYREYRLAGYSDWLRHYALARWPEIRLCLSASELCREIGRDRPYLTAYQFFHTELSPLQSGCCKPPAVCGYEYVNPTLWVNPSEPVASSDCLMWSSEDGRLCYDCASCKGALLGSLRSEWRRAAVVLVIAAVLFVWVYAFACCAFNTTRK